MTNFNQKIQLTRPKQNTFDLSHEKKLSCNMGKLIPILLQDVIPGDKFKVNSEILIRMAPMLAPVYARVNVFTHYFFVPNRLTWNEWEDFITGGEDGTLAPTFPTISITTGNVGSFFKGRVPDFFGVPPIATGTTVTNETQISALPFRAYQHIYNEYYRDQNLTPKVDFEIGGTAGPDIVELTKIRNRAWEKDYFTSALPWAQRGGDVTLPVTFDPTYLANSEAYENGGATPTSGDLTAAAANNLITSAVAGNPIQIQNLEPNQEGVSVTINELRTATRLQAWLEKSARGGSRYAEQLLSFFGVKSSDARLQRPEYLGGGKNPIQISEVLSSYSGTGGGTHDLPQGNMSGHGISMGKQNSFTKRFEEHGYIIGIMSILPRTGYQQGIEKHLQKFDKFEYPWPEFAQLGEQEIQGRELYYDPEATAGDGDETFGYQSRYAEYKFRQGSTHADMRDNLEFWHLNRIFDTKPTLSTEFIEADPDTRIWPVDLPSEDHLYIQLYNKVKVMRSLPYFNTPTIR